jgi:hypothetical protein
VGADLQLGSAHAVREAKDLRGYGCLDLPEVISTAFQERYGLKL